MTECYEGIVCLLLEWLRGALHRRIYLSRGLKHDKEPVRQRLLTQGINTKSPNWQIFQKINKCIDDKGPAKDFLEGTFSGI